MNNKIGYEKLRRSCSICNDELLIEEKLRGICSITGRKQSGKSMYWCLSCDRTVPTHLKTEVVGFGHGYTNLDDDSLSFDGGNHFWIHSGGVLKGNDGNYIFPSSQELKVESQWLEDLISQYHNLKRELKKRDLADIIKQYRVMGLEKDPHIIKMCEELGIEIEDY